jgi:hypothetical protein
MDTLIRLITELLRSNPDSLRWLISLLPPPWRPGPRVPAWPLSPFTVQELQATATRRSNELSELIRTVEKIQILFHQQGFTEQTIREAQSEWFRIKYKFEVQGTISIPNFFKFVGRSLAYSKLILQQLKEISKDDFISGSDIGEHARLIDKELRYVDESLVLLLLASNPVVGAIDAELDPRIRPEIEFKKITEALQLASEGKQLISPIPLYAVERKFLPTLMSKYVKSKTIIHISGHGTNDTIYFQDSDGNPRPVYEADLCEALSIHRKSIVLTVLNVCHSYETSKKLAFAIDCSSIGAADAISDEGATLFSPVFYTNLSDKLGDQMPFNEAAELAFKTALTTLQLEEFFDDRKSLLFTCNEHEKRLEGTI